MRIVNILPHGPFYELLSEHKEPLREWLDPNGHRVAIINREWPGLLGHWVLEQAPSSTWEVWQPDVQATSEYVHQFDDGVVHRLFPADDHTYLRGWLRPVRAPRSRSMLVELAKLRSEN